MPGCLLAGCRCVATSRREAGHGGAVDAARRRRLGRRRWHDAPRQLRLDGRGRRPPDASPIDLAILLDQHMVVVRMRVRHDEKPFVRLWQQFAESQFDSADKNHNGVLDAEEIAGGEAAGGSGRRARNNRNMIQVNRRRGGGPVRLPIVEPTDEAAASREMIPEVTRQEFVEFLRTTANGPIRTEAVDFSQARPRALCSGDWIPTMTTNYRPASASTPSTRCTRSTWTKRTCSRPTNAW